MAYRRPVRQDQIALQLYTVRSLMARDVGATLRAVAEMGYGAVELAGLPSIDIGDFRGMLRETGLRVVASHEGIDRLREGAGAVAERLQSLGCDRAIVPGLPEEERRTPDDVRRLAAELGGLAGELASGGVRLGYHNHAFEFAQLAGTTVWDVLLAELPPTVELELDVFWVSVGGRDPVATIAAAHDRVRLLHMKDRGGAWSPSGEPQDAAAGDGSLDFAAIVGAGRAAGVEAYIVEQDWPEDPLVSARRGLRYLEALADNLPVSAAGSG
jgi:sugar phosphate isomerase/epimerase